MANDIRIGLAVVAEDSVTRKTAQTLKQIEKSQDGLAASLRQGADSADQYTTALKKADKALEEIDEKAKRAAKSTAAVGDRGGVGAANERFDAVSRDVGLAGDIQSNLGAVSGLAGSAGLGGGAIANAGEVVALVEELPRLKTALQGFPATISASAQALGTNSAGLIGSLGALGLAAAAVGVAIKVAADEIGKAVNFFESAISAQVNAEELIASGGTVAEAEQQIEALRAQAEANRVVAQRVRDANGRLAELAENPLLKNLPGFRALNRQLADLDQTARDAELSADALQAAIDEGRLASESAEDREARLKEARENSIASLERLGDTLKRVADIERQARDAIADQRRQTQQGIADQRRAGRRSAQALSRSFSDEAIGQAVALRNNLQGEYIGATRDAARAEREKQARLLDIQRDAQREQEQLARNRDFAGIFGLRQNTANATQDVNTEAARESQERAILFEQRIEDLQREYKIEQGERRRQFEVQQRENAIQNRERISDLRRQGRRRQDEIQRNAQREIDLLADQLNSELTLKQDAYQTSIGLTRSWVEGLLQAQSALVTDQDAIRGIVQDELGQIAGT
jgi:hypothetical protein